VSDHQQNAWWVSWYHDHDAMGAFEMRFPWWRTGFVDDGHNVTICAAVRARNVDEARAAVFTAYDTPPKSIHFRFVDERPADWEPFGERFPRADWMVW
jgi:hypothetical protein